MSTHSCARAIPKTTPWLCDMVFLLLLRYWTLHRLTSYCSASTVTDLSDDSGISKCYVPLSNVQENGTTPLESAPSAPAGISVICWGCGQYLVLPHLAPVFKCGYCGAVTSEAVPKRRPTRCATSAAIRDWGMVAIVVIIIGALTGALASQFLRSIQQSSCHVLHSPPPFIFRRRHLGHPSDPLPPR